MEHIRGGRGHRGRGNGRPGNTGRGGTGRGRIHERAGANNSRGSDQSVNRGRSEAGRSRDRNGQGYIMGYTKLQEIRNKDPKEILQNIILKQSGFPGLIASKGLRPDVISLVLQVLSRACECTTIPACKIKLLTEIVSSDFLKSELARYLTTLITETSLAVKSRGVRNSLSSVLSLLEALLISLPSSLPDAMVVFGSFQMCYRHFKGAGSIPVSSDLELRVSRIQELIDCGTKTKQKQLEKEENVVEDDEAPPDDFRETPTFPQMKDIHLVEEPFLRTNKAKGGYNDLNHYLDVQYRLMREDFVAPLRNGIMEYIDVEQRNERNHKYNDIKLYFGVSIMHPVCTREGILHQIQFDNKSLKRVRWEASKRLIFGSLLCLSRDSFRTLLFATVADRTPAQLQKGIFYVKFEANHAEVAGISPDERFVMAETSAYFEAYRHVLRGLQQVGNNMPFQQYIVNCDNEVQPPLYLRRVANISFDLRPLVDKESKFRNQRRPIRIFEELLEDNSSDDEEDQQPEIDEFDTAANFAASIPILRRERWPSAGQLHLDPSQLKALNSALTNEFAVIQGPPGTGKTYVGLKIVKALLHNRPKWARGDNRPMLVVCYTNHALDQFLEGIQHFHDQGIIRVGGRSKSESLDKYLMKNVRRSKEAQNVIPKHVRQGLWDARRALEEIEETMSRDIGAIKATECGIIGENLLEQFMMDHHYDQLFKTPPPDLQLWERPGKHTSILVEWLGLGNVITQHMEPQENPQNVTQQDNGEEEELIAAEDEVDLLVEQRMLDEEDDEEESGQGNATAGLARPKGAAQIDSQIRIDLSGVVLTIDSFSQEQMQDEFEGEQGGFWEIDAAEKKRRKKRLKTELRKTTMMTEEQVAAVNDIWTLNLDQRWLLYRYWLSRYKIMIKNKMQQRERQYQMEQERLVEVKQQQDLALMQRATVIGMTTTGAARYWRILQQVEPKIIIVEEAAEVLESHIVTTLSPGCEHLILIGDHKQLRPNPTVYKLAKRYNLDISLFERMVNNGMECNTLELQHRMKPEIASIISPIYPELRNHDSVMEYEDILGVSGNMFFVDHKQEEIYNEETKSHSNSHEAQYITALCRYLLQQGYRPDQITVLTTYSGQLFALRKLMPKAVFEGVRLCVVDNYQGEENDIILLSLVRSNKTSKIGFLSIENRVCVALSRAKKGFFVVGNMTLLADSNDLWSDIVRILRRQGSIGPHLELYCRNHTDKKIQAATGKDFQRAPEGGCMEPCQFRLECGHVCEKPCHVLDSEHKEYKCMKLCNKVICINGHRCRKRCHEQCGACIEWVYKKLPLCGHETQVRCHIPAEQWSCREPCGRTLRCGHACKELCGQSCTEICDNLVLKQWNPCGHVKKVKCQTDPVTSPCPRKCETILSCGHECKGTCGKCRNGKIHKACSHPCKRSLVCGHECQEPCTKECPPCQHVCENRCVHSICQGKCGALCVPCMEPCQWQCRHQSCSVLCSEPCDRGPCEQHCPRTLKCGHLCIGLCGEKCPSLCRVCNREDVNEIFFGTEEEEDARFVQLEDCGHVLEVSGLDTWMGVESNNSENISIQLKLCPKCKTPIRRNLRYGKLINSMLNDINNVKERIFGSQIDIEATKNRLIREAEKLEKFNMKIARNFDTQLSGKGLHQEILEMYENQINILQRLFKLRKDIKKLQLTLREPKLENLQDDIEFMLEWCDRPRQRFSQQELTEGPLEVKRISLLFKFIMMQDKAVKSYKDHQSHISQIETTVSELYSCNKLSEQKSKEYIVLFKKLKKELPDTGLGISEEERTMIVTTMGLTKGHWYKCPKGHIYAIGDCGGANQAGKCPECGSAIGGHLHRLVDGNQVAGEMDGARYAAWSEQANLENYVPEDFQ